METHRQQWYRQGLGPRVDALETALKSLDSDQGAAKNIRMIAESLRASSTSYGFPDIFQAARNVEEATAVQLPLLTRTLVNVLRQQLSGQPAPRATILLVGEQSDFMDALQRELAAYSKETMLATTAAQAQQLLTEHEFIFIVLDFVLPDQDGRHLLEILRSKPLTAAIPMVVIAPKINEDVIGRRLVPDVDGYFGKPADPRQVAEFIANRLRRAHEVTRDARRDPLTGLLNRAAFCEHFAQTIQFSQNSQEPVALVLMEIDDFHAIAEEHGTAQTGAILQRVASVLSNSFRATDVVSRWSPSQFTVLFPGEDQFGAIRAIEKSMLSLRREASSPLALPVPPVTLSAGLTVLSGVVTIEKAMEQAEHFLYIASTNGGNRVVTAETSVVRRKDSVLVFARDDIALVLKKILEVNGLEAVLTHRSGDDALQSLAQGRFHLIVLEESGLDSESLTLLSRIRANQRYHRIPIIMLASTEQTAARALDQGANDYVLKPFSPFVFISRVRHLLTRGTRPEQRSHSILLADPDITTLIVTGTTLHKNAGLRVLLARNAHDLLVRLENESPDVILMDPHMPDIHGKELLLRVTTAIDPVKTNIVLAATTNEADASAHMGGTNIRGIITKPFNLQTMVDDLNALLDIKLQAGKATNSEEHHLNKEIQRLLSTPPNAR